MTSSATEQVPGFRVRLTNFEGPFDLLLQLISRHRLDITEVALSVVTDEFLAHVKAGQAERGPGRWDLEQTTQFIVVAATLLDLKAARLLPQGEVDDPEDLALLEARDLLFARLLQYRAFKRVSAWIAGTLAEQSRRHARPGNLEDQFRALLPELQFTATPDQLAWLAARALTPEPAEQVSLSHLHQASVSVREQADIVVRRLRDLGSASFRDLVADAAERLVVVARFLALLELFRERAIAFEQLTPLGELRVRWVAGDADEIEISAEFDTETDAQEASHD
ncbi:segregation and condensation protein A [Micropruina sp.]|uniref:segregation and condensation protein A n=1 Tax=Micropruina sp. TaxID=2737536 RepID=UPI0039E4A2BE